MDSPPAISLPCWPPVESEPSSVSRCRWLLPQLPPPSPALSSAGRERKKNKTKKKKHEDISSEGQILTLTVNSFFPYLYSPLFSRSHFFHHTPKRTTRSYKVKWHSFKKSHAYLHSHLIKNDKRSFVINLFLCCFALGIHS